MELLGIARSARWLVTFAAGLAGGYVVAKAWSEAS